MLGARPTVAEMLRGRAAEAEESTLARSMASEYSRSLIAAALIASLTRDDWRGGFRTSPPGCPAPRNCSLSLSQPSVDSSTS